MPKIFFRIWNFATKHGLGVGELITITSRDELRPLRASVVSHQHSAGSQGPGSSCMHAALDKGPGQGPYAAIV